MRAHITECQKLEEAKKNGMDLAADDVENSYQDNNELGDLGDNHRLRQEMTPDDINALLKQTTASAKPSVRTTNIRETMQKTPTPEEIKASDLIEEDQEMLNLDHSDSNIDEP